jgi:hypothetical protein
MPISLCELSWNPYWINHLIRDSVVGIDEQIERLKEQRRQAKKRQRDFQKQYVILDVIVYTRQG